MDFSKISTIVFIAVLTVLIPKSLSCQSSKNQIKVIQNILSKLQYMEGGIITIGLTTNFQPTKTDTFLLKLNYPRKDTIESFYMSTVEVTNAEWREFYFAMKEKYGEEKAKKEYYPDTLSWTKEFGYSYNENHTNRYAYSIEYSNHPVLGISWEQANAYCEWLSETVHSYLQNKKAKISLHFRLPTEAEWECGATFSKPQNSMDKGINERRFYAWSGHDSYYNNGDEKANFGKIEDTNGLIIKHGPTDGYFYQAPIGSYLPNKNRMYDLSGNVAEWVSDTVNINLEETGIIERLKMITSADSTSIKQRVMDNLARDKYIISKGDTRIVKGGSWDDSLVYMQAGTRQAIDKNHKSCKIGFRIAMDYVPGVEKYLPKKKWEPLKKHKADRFTNTRRF